MWEWELEILADELLDVGALDLVGICEFDDFQNLYFLKVSICFFPHLLLLYTEVA